MEAALNSTDRRWAIGETHRKKIRGSSSGSVGFGRELGWEFGTKALGSNVSFGAGLALERFSSGEITVRLVSPGPGRVF